MKKVTSNVILKKKNHSLGFFILNWIPSYGWRLNLFYTWFSRCIFGFRPLNFFFQRMSFNEKFGKCFCSFWTIFICSKKTTNMRLIYGLSAVRIKIYWWSERKKCFFFRINLIRLNKALPFLVTLKRNWKGKLMKSISLCINIKEMCELNIIGRYNEWFKGNNFDHPMKERIHFEHFKLEHHSHNSIASHIDRIGL